MEFSIIDFGHLPLLQIGMSNKSLNRMADSVGLDRRLIVSHLIRIYIVCIGIWLGLQG